MASERENKTAAGPAEKPEFTHEPAQSKSSPPPPPPAKWSLLTEEEKEKVREEKMRRLKVVVGEIAERMAGKRALQEPLDGLTKEIKDQVAAIKACEEEYASIVPKSM